MYKNILGVGFASFVAFSPVYAYSDTAKIFDNVVYNLDKESKIIKRYSLETESYLPDFAIEENATAFHVDESGVYISYGTLTWKMEHNEHVFQEYRVTSEPVIDIESSKEHLLLLSDEIQLISKSNDIFLTSHSVYSSVNRISVSQNSGHIYFSDHSGIASISLSDQGELGNYRYGYNFGKINTGNLFVLPGEARIINDNGVVYNGSNLRYLNNLNMSFSDMDYWNGLPIIASGNTVYSFNKAMVETGSLDVSLEKIENIAVYKDKVFAFDKGINEVGIVSIDMLSPADYTKPIDPTNLAFEPDEVFLDKDGDTVYLLSRKHLNIFRWSISKQKYLDSIALSEVPRDASYSSDHNRIYLSYSSEEINYVDLSDDKTKRFVSLSSNVDKIDSAGRYLISIDSSGHRGTYSVFDKNGVKTHSNDWASYNNGFFWGAAKNRVYYIDSQSSPSDLHWHYLNPTTGELGKGKDSPYHNSAGWSLPISISELGNFVALSSGRIVDGLTLKEVAYLKGGSFEDITWLFGNVYTLKNIDQGTYSLIQRWNADFSKNETDVYQLLGKPYKLFPLPEKNSLLVMYFSDDVLQFKIIEQQAQDFDQDGYQDHKDEMPEDSADWLDTDNDGIGNQLDEDDDGDGFIDELDDFPLDEYESVDTDKDGIGNNADFDDDNDTVADKEDAFPLDPTESLDTDGDRIGNNADTDDDGDWVPDDQDAFPLDHSESKDTDGDGIGNNKDKDDDNDGYLDYNDDLPLDPSDHIDTDRDGVGNSTDDDDDGDGVVDTEDDFPLDGSESQDSDNDGIGNNSDGDDDNDGVIDYEDDLPLDPTETRDTDGDGIGNNKDTDDDGDGVSDQNDAFPLNYYESIDTDKDGIGNNQDQDDDNDGTDDYRDDLPLDPTETRDTDGDGIGNNKDTDDDNDGFLDIDDAFPLDKYEWLDSDLDGIGNNQDYDDDGDGVSDSSDFYPLDPEKNAIEADGFLPLNPGSHWTFESGQKIEIGTVVSIAGQVVTPLVFNNGSKLYFSTHENKINLHGFYVPKIGTQYGAYSADFKLNNSVDLTGANYATGDGSVYISPTYGLVDLGWTADIGIRKTQTLSTSAGDFAAFKVAVRFDGYAQVGGGQVYAPYSIDLWFADGIGIVQYTENGETSSLSEFELTDTEIPTTVPSKKSGGGSLNWLLLASLLSMVGLRRRFYH